MLIRIHQGLSWIWRLTWLSFWLVLLYWLAALIVPVNPAEFSYQSPESFRLLDRHGRLIREQAGATGERAHYMAFTAFAPDLVQATIAIEDRNFRAHAGVDWGAFLRATWQNILNQRLISGASTISMQTARLIRPGAGGIVGKIEQVFLALRLERVYSKDQILELYLNLAPYGYGCIGAEAASQRYFDKAAAELTFAEAAFLAGLPQAPGLYNPQTHYHRALKRMGRVLDALESVGQERRRISLARANPPTIVNQQSRSTAGHFGDWVLSFRPPTGNVQTSLDLDFNDDIERMVAVHVEQLSAMGLGNAAVIVVDNHTAEVLAMVGSRDWQSPNAGAVNGLLALRQPGSTLKPFAYELALEMGVSTRTVLPDIKTTYLGADRTVYSPQNYSRQYRGPVLFNEALAMSLNVPAIRLVDEKIGLDNFLERLRKLGFSSLDKSSDYYGLGLVLGNGEVRAIELVQAYVCLARGGELAQLSALRLSPGSTAAFVRVLEPGPVAAITTILADDRLRIQAFGIDHPLLFDFPVALKTGTSSQWRDTWCVGYTPDITVLVWNGNFDGTPMDEISSTVAAGTLFSRVLHLARAYGYSKDRDFSANSASSLRMVSVCALSGGLAGPLCDRTSSVPVLETDAPPECNVHMAIDMDSRTGLRAQPGTPARFIRSEVFLQLPAIYDEWLADNQKKAPPPELDTPLRIIRPRPGDVYVFEPGYDPAFQTLELSVQAATRPAQVEWILDGKSLASVPWPYTWNMPLQRGSHTLVVKAGKIQSEPVQFLVK